MKVNNILLSDHHCFIFYENGIKAIRTLDGKEVWNETLPNDIIGIEKDEIYKTYWLYSNQSIFELNIKDEDADLWLVYLNKNDFENALTYCKNNDNQDIILTKQANHYFKNEKYIQSAQIYSKVKNQSFESIVLKFIDKNERDGLRYYLISKLDKLKKNANRMKILSVNDLQRDDAIRAMKRIRKSVYTPDFPDPLVRDLPDNGESVYDEVYRLIGGRMSHISHVAKEIDLLGSAQSLVKVEKAWLLSQIGLIPDMDDDVMDEQKWSSCSWALLAYLSRQKIPGCEDEDEEDTTPDPVDPSKVPHVSYYKARQLMSRTGEYIFFDR